MYAGSKYSKTWTHPGNKIMFLQRPDIYLYEDFSVCECIM